MTRFSLASLPLNTLRELLVNGLTEKEILKEYPLLKAEDIKAVLLYPKPS
jgi:uncharacterized protein (DUF433 family)